MKSISNPRFSFIFSLIAGFAGFVLRLWRFQTGVDHKGLLIPGHFATIACFCLSVLVLIVLFICCPAAKEGPYKTLFPKSILAGIGNFIAAAGIVYYNAFDFRSSQETIVTVSFCAGLLAAAALLYVGICRIRGTYPSVTALSIPVFYLVVHLVAQYRFWSPEPQLETYCYQLFASIALMLRAYHRAALADDSGNPKWFCVFNYAALFFCFVSLYSQNTVFYLAMVLWLSFDRAVTPTASADTEELPHAPSE